MIFHLALIPAFVQILDAKPRSPASFLMKTKSGKIYLVGATNKDNAESFDILNRDMEGKIEQMAEGSNGKILRRRKGRSGRFENEGIHERKGLGKNDRPRDDGTLRRV